ncbi:MAG: CDC27 family protein [Spirochaetaceae bacterium]|jgi:tetratricopeptide (TPR) repeat protein|nr:CDC27 family protein [Spirochaetaceae bacterium]
MKGRKGNGDPFKRGKTGPLIGVFVFLIVAGGIAFIFYYQKNKERVAEAIAIAAYGPRKGVPKEIEDLERAIKVYEKQLDRHVKDAAQTGIYWKILGTRFSEKGMHLEALKAFQEAMRYNTEEAVLYYLTGVSAGRAGKFALEFERNGGEAAHYYQLSEEAYLRAIALDERYSLALFGLAVLYTFELNRPLDAIPRIERYMELRSGDIDALFILARCYYMSGQYRRALDQYDIIISTTKDSRQRAEAEENRRAVQEVYNG